MCPVRRTVLGGERRLRRLSMSAGTNSGGKTHVLRQEVTVAKWSVLKRTSTGLRRYVELRLKCAEITKNADSTRRARARPPSPAFGRLSNVPFPIETTAARRDAFVVFRVTFFASHHSHLVSSVSRSRRGARLVCGPRRSDGHLLAEVAHEQDGAHEEPRGAEQVLSGSEGGAGGRQTGLVLGGRAGEGRTTPAIAEVNAVILDANALVPWCSPGSGERTPCR